MRKQSQIKARLSVISTEPTWPDSPSQASLSGSGDDSGKASPLVSQPNPIFFPVIPLPLFNTAALSELSPHKLPLECQRQSNNRDGAVA